MSDEPRDVRGKYREGDLHRTERKIFSSGIDGVEDLVMLGAKALQEGISEKKEGDGLSFEELGGREEVLQMFQTVLSDMEEHHRQNPRVLAEILAAAIALFHQDSREVAEIRKSIGEFASEKA